MTAIIAPSTLREFASVVEGLGPNVLRRNLTEAADEIERLTRENARLRGALVTLSRYDDGLRASNWPGLADVVREALAPRDDGSKEEGTR